MHIIFKYFEYDSRILKQINESLTHTCITSPTSSENNLVTKGRPRGGAVCYSIFLNIVDISFLAFFVCLRRSCMVSSFFSSASCDIFLCRIRLSLPTIWKQIDVSLCQEFIFQTTICTRKSFDKLLHKGKI